MANTLFIVEPDDKFIKALKLYFRGSEFDVDAFESVDAALGAAPAKPPDVVLIAVDPASGTDPATEIRRLTAGVSCPVLVMSPKKKDTEFLMGGVKNVGAAAYIKKPFIKKAILQLLGEVLGPGASSGGAEVAFELETDSSSGETASDGGMQLGDIIAELDQEVDTFFTGDGSDASSPSSSKSWAAAAALTPLSDSGAGDDDVLAFESAPEPARTPDPAPSQMRRAPVSDDAGGTDAKRLKARIRELEDELVVRADEAKTAARDKERIERELGAKEVGFLEKIRSLEKQAEDHEEDIKKRKQLVSQLSESIKSLNEEIEEKDRKLREGSVNFDGQLAGLQEEVRALTEQVSLKTHEVEDRVDEVSRLTRREQELGQELAELGNNFTRTTEERNAAEARIEEIEGRLKGVRDDLERSTGELGDTRGQLERTTGELMSTRTDLEQRTSELGATRSDLASTKAALEAELENLKAELSGTRARLDAARNALEQGLAAITG